MPTGRQSGIHGRLRRWLACLLAGLLLCGSWNMPAMAASMHGAAQAPRLADTAHLSHAAAPMPASMAHPDHPAEHDMGDHAMPMADKVEAGSQHAVGQHDGNCQSCVLCQALLSRAEPATTSPAFRRLPPAPSASTFAYIQTPLLRPPALLPA